MGKRTACWPSICLGVPCPFPPPRPLFPGTPTAGRCKMRKSRQSQKSRCTRERLSSCKLRSRSIWHDARRHILSWPVRLNLASRKLILCASSLLSPSSRLQTSCIQRANSPLVPRSNSIAKLIPSWMEPILRRKVSEHSRICNLSERKSTSTSAGSASVSGAAGGLSPSSSRMPTKCRRRLPRPANPMLKSSTSWQSPSPSPSPLLTPMARCRTSVFSSSSLGSAHKRSRMSCRCSSDGRTSSKVVTLLAVLTPPRCRKEPSSGAPLTIRSSGSSSRITS
mmetsp:Transcript_51967/g.161265  ORF Transcript_51967/g.161265 Transcript_51967/m.161265 type:complete len:280 (+) Transcript_51967:255-1094(+)